MTRKRKILLTLTAVLIAAVACFITFIGPWPTYRGNFEEAFWYKDALTAIRQHATISSHDDIQPFRASWSQRSIDPPPGTPLAGYGDRKGKPATGTHDPIQIKVLAVSDGTDTAVIIGADMLIIPENVADLIRARVSEQTSLTPNDILFNATHTHSGPGAFGPGPLSKLFNGPYDPDMPPYLSRLFVEAIIEAFNSLEPAGMTHGSFDAPQYIRNRTRKDAPVDSELSYLLIEQEDGDCCYIVSYSAHPTILGDDNMQFSADYPGYLTHRITEKTGAPAIFLGGAAGSMGPNPPEASDDFERCRVMGEALADIILEAGTDDPILEKAIDVASIGIPIQLPPFQIRLSEGWRVSKFLPPMLGLDSDGWMHALRIGDTVLVGLPGDYCGEISADLKSRAAPPLDLWVLSFNGDYAGYISPDKYYYDKEPGGGYGYERGTMSWTGPNQEAFTVSLIQYMVTALFPDRTETLR